jgi:hypothetical protein
MKTCAILIIKRTYYHCFRWRCSLLMCLKAMRNQAYGSVYFISSMLYERCLFHLYSVTCPAKYYPGRGSVNVLMHRRCSFHPNVKLNICCKLKFICSGKSPLHGDSLTSLLDISTWILHLLTVTCNQSITMHIRTRSSLLEQCHHLFSFFKML